MDVRRFWVSIVALVLVVGLAIGGANLIGLRGEPVTAPPVEGIVPPMVLPPLVDVPIEVPDEPGPVDYVQLSSHRSESSAERAVKIHGLELKGLVSASLLKVYKVTLSSGTWYRVVLPQDSRQEAEATCGKVKAAGHDCLVFTF